MLQGANPTRSTHEIISSQCVVATSSRASDSQADTLMYIFNFADESGFSIVAANSTVEPIIAVSDRGNYTYGVATGIDGFDCYMETAVQTLSHGDLIGGGVISRYRDITRITDESNGPLLNTKWGQSSIYGQYCPNGISGCVATAIAQIMAYHQKPNEFIITATDVYNHPEGSTCSMNWANICNHVWFRELCSCSTETHEQIGVLLREIGERIDMSYGTSSSSAFTSLAKGVFESFGYEVDSSLTAFANVGFETINSCLENDRPILIRGSRITEDGGSAGHAWVIDGYQFYQVAIDHYVLEDGQLGEDTTDLEYVYQSTTISEELQLLHFNWGWDGQCDGFFSANVYNSSLASSYDNTNLSNTTNRDYCNSVQVLINIH